MKKEIIRNNASHEAGHWLTGWILGQSSQSILISCESNGPDSYCERKSHPDFLTLSEINENLGHRVINLLSGAKAECLVMGEFKHEIYKDLVSDYKGAWPDYFMASELFRYYYRSIPEISRKSFEEEWRELERKCEEIILSNIQFINSVASAAIDKAKLSPVTVTISFEEMIDIFHNSK